MADGGGDLVANFMAITGADDGVAIQMLEAANFSLEDAVNLFFAADGHVGGSRTDAGVGSSGAAGGGSSAAGRRGGSAAPADLDEDDIRAPLPTKVERLNDFDPKAMYLYHGLSGRPQPSTHVDVFRDFRAETQAASAKVQAAGAAGSAAPGAGGDAAAGGSSSGQPQGLSGLFKLPEDLVFNGNAELAKARAAAEGKWLLVNVQSNTEFASHRLNRDTWAHEALKEVLKGTFVFYQANESSPDGRALIKAYRLDPLAHGSGSLPAILVVDPITGAQLWQRAGFIDAEKLMEELVPFMDHGPLDAGASGLAQNTMKRKAAGVAATASGASGPVGGADPGGGMTEEDELALAIAMSMERGGASAAGAAGGAAAMEEGSGAGALEDLDEALIWEQIKEAERKVAEAAAAARVSPEEVAAAALARVPPEPAEADPEAVRVALRMPDGSRLARRFRRDDTVQVLLDLAVAKVPEAAAGRSVTISHAMPGGQVLADPSQTLGAAGVAGAMLAIKLTD